jgi:hypothetical protein
MTLVEAAFSIAAQLDNIARREKRSVRIAGLHSITQSDDPGMLSVWLDLDPATANDGMGIVSVRVDEAEVAHLDSARILSALVNDGQHATRH